MDELGGKWEFTYGGKKREATIDTSEIAVRAGPDASRALGTIAAEGAESVNVEAFERMVVAFEEARDVLFRQGPEFRDERLEYWMHRMLDYPFVRFDGAFNRDAVSMMRAVRALAQKTKRGRHTQAFDELIAALEALHPAEPLAALRAAPEGTWVRVPTSVIEHTATLQRTAGALGLVERGTDRLLTDTAFALLAEDVPLERLHRVLAEAGWLLKSRLSFHPKAIVVQRSAQDDSSFSALRRAFTEVPSLFERLEPIFLEPIHGRWRPNDPRYPEQWQWNNNGRNSGTRGADIRAERAWDRTRGKGVRVAIIDNGIHINHPDLKSAIKRGGWFDGRTSNSASFIELSASNRAQFPVNDHGTFCAGMAGARANKQGGCGAAPECELVAIACLEDQVGTQLTLARAIAYAADPSREVPDSKDRGADVISCSLGPNSANWQLSTPLELAIEFATRQGRDGKGTPIFWAASNAQVDITLDEVVSHPSVIAVSRSNNNDGYDNAAFGASLAFVAPGVDVLSTSSASSYATKTGCSFAAPLAAGVAALVLARDSQLNATAVKDRLCATCDKVGGYAYAPNGRNDRMGHGRINADKAVP